MLSVFALAEININRVNIFFVPLIFFAAVAIRELATSRAAWREWLRSSPCCSLSSRTRASAQYRAAAAPAFHARLGDPINEVSRSTIGPVCVTALAAAPYVYALFDRKIDPNVLLRSVR